MSEPILEKLERSIRAAEEQYHRLVLLVGESGSGKTAVLKELAMELGASVINVNLELSSRLLELNAKQRVLRLDGIFKQITIRPESIVILDNLDLLFNTDLKQDPLRLLLSVSRNRTVVASWVGPPSLVRLEYGEAWHRDYRKYDSGDLLVVSTTGLATIDSIASV